MARDHHRLIVWLPEDRAGIGDALLLTSAGLSFGPFPVLGKADSRMAARHGNPARDPVKPYGDTPTGTYRLASWSPVPAGKQARFGALWFPLVGQSGQARRAVEGGRSGLMIHGGRGDRLVATYGCLRLRDRDVETIATRCALIGAGSRMAVTVTVDRARFTGAE